MVKSPIIEIIDEADQTSPVMLGLKHNSDYQIYILAIIILIARYIYSYERF
jgi:hypothetical protein